MSHYGFSLAFARSYVHSVELFEHEAHGLWREHYEPVSSCSLSNMPSMVGSYSTFSLRAKHWSHDCFWTSLVEFESKMIWNMRLALVC